MLIFISGGVRSGKSTLGENMAEKLAAENGGRKIYLATAQVYDDEMRERVKRHQQNRSAKNYTTIEKSCGIAEIIGSLTPYDTVLLDCLGNLAANEMFGGCDKTRSCTVEGLAERIFVDIKKVNAAVGNLIIISNEVFSCGICYDKEVEAYTDLLGKLHVKIAAIADAAVECACGINIYHKGVAL